MSKKSKTGYIIYTKEEKDQIVKEYQIGADIDALQNKYKFRRASFNKWLKERGIPTPRFMQRYIPKDDHTEIQIKSKQGEDGYVYALIDNEDVEKCKNEGIWSLTKAGYVECCATGKYLHRLVMNCPDNMEVDHINHDLLDNRKEKLRLATSSQQKMNQHRRKDNSSGHRGVHYDWDRGTWNVNINVKDKHFRKRYKSKKQAFEVADMLYDKYFGEYRYENSMDNGESA